MMESRCIGSHLSWIVGLIQAVRRLPNGIIRLMVVRHLIHHSQLITSVRELTKQEDGLHIVSSFNHSI